MEQGGTGADNREDAVLNLLYLGLNPITGVEEDTPKKWLEIGIGFAVLGQTVIQNQPSDMGFLINITAIRTTRNVVQIFFPLGGLKTIYFRTGYESTGWNFQWTAQGTVPAADEPENDLGMM